MSKNNQNNFRAQKSVDEEIQAEQEAASIQPGDYKKAKSLKLSDAEHESVEDELNAAANKRSTGFETAHAKDFQKSPYKSNFVDEFVMTHRDPNRCYKQISFNHFRENGYRDSRGWVPLTKANSTLEVFPNPNSEYGVAIQSDGFWHVGDCIWAWMPRENYKQIRQMIRLKTQARTRSLTEKFKNQVNRDLGKINGKNAYEVEENVMGPA